MRISKKIARLNVKIKKNWGKLSDEEVDSYQTRPDLFYSSVKEKYGMFQDDIEKSIKKLKASGRFFGW